MRPRFHKFSIGNKIVEKFDKTIFCAFTNPGKEKMGMLAEKRFTPMIVTLED